MYIVSFDIGVKNLAYCYTNNEEILEWSIIDISGKDITEISQTCMKKLYDIFNDKQINKVLIENQPVQKNPKMKSIQIMVYSFFVNQKINSNKEIDNILLVSATNKNKYTLKYDIEVPKCSTKYLETKKRSIACTKLIIEQNENWSTYFNSHKKKDDLADCLLQCYQFINYCPVLPNPPSDLSVSSSDSTSTTSQQEIYLSSS